MCKPNNKIYSILGFIKSTIHWLKRKIILILVLSMIGISNGMNEEDKMIIGNQYTIEQEQKKNDEDIFE
ncbi:MAG: hypothetical protein J7K34_01650 [Flavobacteriaceae bacterium]|nr:hypothetical protein [Flavobacteriaceae bacterium]